MAPIRRFKKSIFFFCLFYGASNSFSFGMDAFAFSIPQPLPGEAQAISVAGSTIRIKGLTDQANQLTVNGREMKIENDGSFNEEMIIPLGETEIQVRAVTPGGEVSEYTKKIKAKEDSFFMTGIADGTLNFTDASEGFKLKRDSKSYKKGFEPDGKVSYYATGKLNGRYLFKSGLDTDKSTEDKLFTSIDPDKYYPIYGDNSTVVYDVNSQGKFYGLFEWDKSGAVFGNYQTQIGEEEDVKFSTYNRTLYGAKVHFETPKRTIYGDPVNKTDVFVAEANQRAGHSELLGTGASLYYLRHRNIIEGSEQVRLEVRDKRSGMTIRSIPQSQKDYEIKYDEGRILFKKPVYSVAESDTITSTSPLEGNLVYVVVNYEYKSQDAFTTVSEDLDNRTGGARLSQHIGDHIRTGVTYVQEQKDAKSHKLIGGDATVKLGNFTKVNLEVAHSKADSTKSYISYNGGYDYSDLTVDNLEDGLAMRAEFNSSLGEYLGHEKEFLNLSGYWQKVDKTFAPVDALYEGGTIKQGIELSHRISLNDRLRLLYQSEVLTKDSLNQASINQIQAKRTKQLTGQWEHIWQKFTFTTEYTFRQKSESLSLVDQGKGIADGHLLAERIQYDFSEKTSVYIGQQLGLKHIHDSFTTAGITQKFLWDTTLRADVGAGPLGNSLQAGVEKWVDPNHSFYLNRRLLDSAADGKSSVTSFGSNTKVSNTATLRRERQFVSSDTRGVYSSDLMGYQNKFRAHWVFDATFERRDETANPVVSGSAPREAFSSSLGYARPDKLKVFTKNEYRRNTDNLWQILTDSQGELKLTRDLSFYLEYELSLAEKDVSRIDKKQAAFAYRPVDHDWFNALFKYIRLIDRRPDNLLSADGGFLQTQSTSDVIATEFSFDTPYRIQFVEKLAFKDEDILAVDVNKTIKTPENLQAFLAVQRINYHLTNKVDLAIEYRGLKQVGSSTKSLDRGFLIEATYQFVKHMAVGAGFNFTDFSEDLLRNDDSSAKGFFIRLQGKY